MWNIYCFFCAEAAGICRSLLMKNSTFHLSTRRKFSSSVCSDRNNAGICLLLESVCCLEWQSSALFVRSTTDMGFVLSIFLWCQKQNDISFLSETEGELAENGFVASLFFGKSRLFVSRKVGCREGKGCPICWERLTNVFRNLSRRAPEGLPIPQKRYIQQIFIHIQGRKAHFHTDFRSTILSEAEISDRSKREKS